MIVERVWLLVDLVDDFITPIISLAIVSFDICCGIMTLRDINQRNNQM